MSAEQMSSQPTPEEIIEAYLADTQADDAARQGKWDTWAQPGYEEQVRSIAIQAQEEHDKLVGDYESKPDNGVSVDFWRA